jgi:drug/metabolite transporter (DMT)-like permease
VSSNILGSFIQIASLPVVILAPLGAVSLLWNAFFARLLLGDVFSPWMILGTLLIAGGAVLIGIFGIVPEPTRSVEDLLDLFTRPTFIAYFSLLGVTVVACLAVTHIVEFSFTRRIAAQSYRLHTPQRPRSPQPSQHPSVLSTNITDETLTERTPLLDPKVSGSSRSSVHTLSSDEGRSTKRTRILLAISYASFSGIISGMCLLFAKSGVELLLLTFQGKNQFWRWEAWLLLLALVVFALLQLWYLHKALILADPTLVCPCTVFSFSDERLHRCSIIEQPLSASTTCPRS